MAKEQEPGRMGAMIKVMASVMPPPYNNPGYLRAVLEKEIPELKRRDTCPNCDASMKSEIYKIDALDARLIKWMGDEIRARTKAGMTFTEANKELKPYLEQSFKLNPGAGLRASKCSKLGLVAKSSNHKGTGWLITRRGINFIRNEPVPYKIKVWRGQITERFDNTITFEKIRNEWLKTYEKRTREGKKGGTDLTDLKEWNPDDYANIENPKESRIL